MVVQAVLARGRTIDILALSYFTHRGSANEPATDPPATRALVSAVHDLALRYAYQNSDPRFRHERPSRPALGADDRERHSAKQLGWPADGVGFADRLDAGRPLSRID